MSSRLFTWGMATMWRGACAWRLRRWPRISLLPHPRATVWTRRPWSRPGGEPQRGVRKW